MVCSLELQLQHCFWRQVSTSASLTLLNQSTLESLIRIAQVNQRLTTGNTEGRGTVTWLTALLAMTSAELRMDRLDQELGWKDLQREGEKIKLKKSLHCSKWIITNSGADILPSTAVVYQHQLAALYNALHKKWFFSSSQTTAAWHLSNFQHATKHLWNS